MHRRLREDQRSSTGGEPGTGSTITWSQYCAIGSSTERLLSVPAPRRPAVPLPCGLTNGSGGRPIIGRTQQQLREDQPTAGPR